MTFKIFSYAIRGLLFVVTPCVFSNDRTAESYTLINGELSGQIHRIEPEVSSSEWLVRAHLQHFTHDQPWHLKLPLALEFSLAAETSPEESDQLRLDNANITLNLMSQTIAIIGRHKVDGRLNQMFEESLSKNDQLRHSIQYTDGLALRHRWSILDQQLIMEYDHDRREWMPHYQGKFGVNGYGYAKVDWQGKNTDDKSAEDSPTTLSLHAQYAIKPLPGAIVWHWQRQYSKTERRGQFSLIWQSFVPQHSIGYRHSELLNQDTWRYLWRPSPTLGLHADFVTHRQYGIGANWSF